MPRKPFGGPPIPTYMSPYMGLQVVEDRHMTVPGVVIRNPHPWVEYEEKDYPWLLALGMAYRGPVPDPQVYLMGRMVIGHPATIEKLKKLLAGGELRVRPKDAQGKVALRV